MPRCGCCCRWQWVASSRRPPLHRVARRQSLFARCSRGCSWSPATAASRTLSSPWCTTRRPWRRRRWPTPPGVLLLPAPALCSGGRRHRRRPGRGADGTATVTVVADLTTQVAHPGRACSRSAGSAGRRTRRSPVVATTAGGPPSTAPPRRPARCGCSSSRARPPCTGAPPAAGVTVAPLWPALDASGLGELVTRLAPALLGQTALDLLRRLDDTAKPVIDAALDGFGLLDTAGDVRLPVGLVQDPSAGCSTPVRWPATRPGLVRLVDAVKPLLGLTGGPGQLP